MLYVSIISVLLGCIFYVLVGAPLRAGLWTGQKSTKHMLHRYMGLFFLIQYSLAWVEFLTDYETAKTTYFTHSITLNGRIESKIVWWYKISTPWSLHSCNPSLLLSGMIQGYSAFFSFKVLPELNDAGYYSDKAVISRNFVHENIFFTLMTVWGSIYYNAPHREQLLSTTAGQCLIYLFVFWPYIFIRPLFPITRFKDAGTIKNSRSEKNSGFYKVATQLVKIFYLWAKYFLGFFMNFMVFLNVLTERQWKFVQGMYLLNVGTVSIAIFLHTLRFKKVLPPKLTFTFYLLQIYA